MLHATVLVACWLLISCPLVQTDGMLLLPPLLSRLSLPVLTSLVLSTRCAAENMERSEERSSQWQCSGALCDLQHVLTLCVPLAVRLCIKLVDMLSMSAGSLHHKVKKRTLCCSML